MRKLLMVAVAAAFVLSTGSMAWADKDRASNRPARKHFAARVDKQLNLTDQQKAQIKEIRTKAREDAKKAETPEAKREIRKAAQEKIRTTVLTDDQRAKMTKMRDGMKHRKFAGKPDLTDDQKAKIKDIMAKAKAEAAKADTPKAKKEIMAAARKDIRKNVLTGQQGKKQWGKRGGARGGMGMKELNLTDDQKAKVKEIMTAANKEAREARAKIMKDARDKVKTTVLTQEQAKKFDELKAKNPGRRGGAEKPAGK